MVSLLKLNQKSSDRRHCYVQICLSSTNFTGWFTNSGRRSTYFRGSYCKKLFFFFKFQQADKWKVSRKLNSLHIKKSKTVHSSMTSKKHRHKERLTHAHTSTRTERKRVRYDDSRGKWETLR